MHGNGAASAGHACCLKKFVCACEADLQTADRGATPVSGRIACHCTLEPEPENSAPQTVPIRLYVTAALPPRAGPAQAVAASSLAIAPVPISVFTYRIVPPSPPRAPPF